MKEHEKGIRCKSETVASTVTWTRRQVPLVNSREGVFEEETKSGDLPYREKNIFRIERMFL